MTQLPSFVKGIQYFFKDLIYTLFVSQLPNSDTCISIYIPKVGLFLISDTQLCKKLNCFGCRLVDINNFFFQMISYYCLNNFNLDSYCLCNNYFTLMQGVTANHTILYPVGKIHLTEITFKLDKLNYRCNYDSAHE